jgi:uncharacterized protein (TIGR02145 family)
MFLFLSPSRYNYLLFFCLLCVSCKKAEDSVTELADNLLVIRTDQAVDISGNSALGKGNIKINGSTSVTALGVCWSTSPNPTTSSNSSTYSGSRSGAFSCPITGLIPGTTYYVRSYATVSRLSGNVSSFTAYGNQIQFTTSASDLPTLSTKAVSSISGTGASSGGVISNDGGKTITAKGVCWSTSPNPTIALSNKTSNGTGIGSFTSTITGLSVGTTYYVRAYASNSSGTGYGEELSFSSLSNGLPSISTTVVSSITTSTATSGGNITNSGSSAVLSRGVVWSTSQNPTIALSTKTNNGTGIGSFISNLTGLSAGTTYYVRAYATNNSGTVYGIQSSFSSAAVVVPTISTTSATAITSTTASSGGNLNNDGGGAITARGVCWSTSQNPTIALTTKTLNGTGAGSFTSNLTNLIPNTLYYFRAYATNSAGTAYGNQQTLTTTTATSGIFNPNLTYSTLSDNDGNTYKTIVIGTQTWMAENLKTTKYRNGNIIPTNLSDANWQSTASGAYAIYNNDAANNTSYGKLYNWYAVADSRNLCPTGWHVPSDAEWTTLVNFLGGSSAAGGKLKSTYSLWTSPNTGATNESGFSALPGGFRFSNGPYDFTSDYGYWWSSTQFSTTYAWSRFLNSSSSGLGRGNGRKQGGYSVRCLKD